ncbi:MAG: TonB-dependent receptor [Xanthomonadales bacterium]|nr:TonB-dependent receptor [Xanthomonadales bacterium]
MNNRFRFITQISIALLMFLVSAVALAQETTSAARVTLYGPDGNAVSGQSVSITDTRTGATRSSTTSESGAASFRGLPVGGPYTVSVSSPNYANQTITDISLQLGDTYDVVLQLGSSTLEEVVVTAAMVETSRIATGPSSIFGLSDLENFPSINRDIRDIIQVDPRVYIDLGNRGSLQCAGANPRFNSLTVDGTRMNDNFGLNSSGYPTERQPFPFDSLQQIAVELAPFDVEYGGFSSCNINAVTKSGQNEWHGSAFYDYTSDSMTGDKINSKKINVGSFTEQRYGATLSGPIIKNKLFFFAAYEYLDGADTFDRGPADSDRALPVEGVSQAQFDEINQIAMDLYGYDPGGLPLSEPVTDEKIFLRLDWNINDDHRAALTYNWNDGYTVSGADRDSNELEFGYHYYERGAELTNYAGQLFSSWTDNFTTEAKVSYTELDNRQLSLNGIDFGEVQINTQFDHDGDGNNSRATVYLGADDSRHANKLYYETLQLKLAGTYTIGDHAITGGFEQEGFDVFNLFIQEAEGEYRFSNIAAFRAGTPNRITYENAAPSNIKADAAAAFQYDVNTAYLQDEFVVGDVTLIAGLRYDWYTGSDVPRQNDKFQGRYGFSNQQNLDGKDLFQPRLGFNWNVSDQLLVHGGVGRFGGGNPNVWLSNSYSTDGQTQVERQDRSGRSVFGIPFNGTGRPIWDIPQELFDAVASGTADSDVNATDPGFKIPSTWKINLGFNYNFGADQSWKANGDIIYSKAQDSATVVELTSQRVGTAPDGRPIYRQVDLLDPDCAIDPAASNCSSRRNLDFLLTNVEGSDAQQTLVSVGIGKEYYDAGFDWFLAYAYTKAEDVNPMTSSVAFSNFSTVTAADVNRPDRAPTDYVIPHRFTLRLNWGKAFFGDNMTRVNMFISHNEGRPYSYTFDTTNMFGDPTFFDRARSLLYVPTGISDSRVNFAPGFDTDAFFDFVNQSGLSKYAGEIAPRNEFNSSWWTKADLKISQEFPSLVSGHKFEAFLIIENLTNLINSEWGVLEEVSFPRIQPIVDASIGADGKYLYEEFIQPSGESVVTTASQWKARIGLRYTF